MHLSINGLSPEPFAPLFALDDEVLLARGIRRATAHDDPGIGYPCRVSLDFATAGEELLLLNHRHLDKPDSPYRSEGPIYVRRGVSAFRGSGEMPPIIMQRAMSIRAYDTEGMMIEAEVAEKDTLVTLVKAWLAMPGVAHVDVHSLRRGCFFCRINRA